MSMIFDTWEAESKIKYTFKNKSLLRQAFTHSSYSNENSVQSNERLEFLGDSILSFVISDYIYKKHPAYTEGELTGVRASIVSEDPLFDAVEALGLTSLVLLGNGEQAANKGEKRRNKFFSDIFEAVVGAIYLDGGMSPARDFILLALKGRLSGAASAAAGGEDYKSRLSEYCQKRYKKKVVYNYIAEDIAKPQFTAAAVLNGKAYPPATARNKKTAEKFAAKNALEALKQGE